jgi:phospholipid/cholesterol/gamma-HCH transport system permease protein
MLTQIFGSIGRQILIFCHETGRMAILLIQILRHGPSILKKHGLTTDQMMKIGVLSLPLVTVVSIFTGAVSSWQAADQFRGLISLDFLGAAVSAAIFIELSPVLTGLVVAGRVGASIAAELGTMKVTEQIDALESLAIDPIRYLAFPRFTAGWVTMPILVIYSNIVAHFGAFLVASYLMGVSRSAFFGSVQQYFLVHNVISGLIKALFFGGGTALVGCAVGFSTTGGAQGVGQSTIKAFVYSSAFILIADYILATFLF